MVRSYLFEAAGVRLARAPIGSVRRTILCLATAFLWAIYDPNMASGQSSELMEAYNGTVRQT